MAEEFEVTPEEARFLHRFVRRALLPWIALVGALAGLALGVALSPAAPVERAAPAPAVQASAAQDELRAEIERLREELDPRLAKLEASLAKRAEPIARAAESASPGVSAADLAAISARLYDLERSVHAEPSAPAAPAPAAIPE
jgi:flagellar motility protein MotE (MotC chaperone)